MGRKKLLLVDDSRFLLMANERALTKAGFEVVTAHDVEEALRAAVQHMPDAIVLDMLLPKISGPDVLKLLKARAATRQIPVMVLSGLAQKNEERLMKDGAAAYFEKSSLGLHEGSDLLVAAVELLLNQTHPAKPARDDQE